MRNISPGTKLTIIRKAVSRNGQSITDIASENGVGVSTLNKWLKVFRETHGVEGEGRKGLVGLPASLLERFKHIQATFGQDAVTVGAYCRRHGIYPHELSEWENSFMKNADQKNLPKSHAELKALRAENKALRRAIMRKDKALAETVALLVLKKKALQIWGENEDD